MPIPLQSLLELLPQLRDRNSDASTNVSFSIPFMIPFRQVGLPTGNGSGPDANIPSTTNQHASSDSGALGRVYSGGMPPSLWIQRQQQLPTFPLPSSTISQTFDETKLREEGNKAFREGCYVDALNLYTQAIEKNPKQELNYSNRSFVHYKLGNYEASANDASEAIRINPSFYKAYYRLGLAQVALGEYATALDNFKKALDLAGTENKQTIAVAIAKCESKLLRAPNNSVNNSLNSNSLKSPYMTKSIDTDGYPFAQEVDYTTLSDRIASIIRFRTRIDSYQKMFKEQEDIVNCTSRGLRVKNLLSIATTHKLSELCKHAQDMQEELRNTLKTQDRASYHNAKRNRDETYKNVWETASEVENVITELRTIAKEEKNFFERFGKKKEEAQDEAPKELTNNEEFLSRVSSSFPESNQSPPKDSPSSLQDAMPVKSNFETLLKRRLTIHEHICKIQRYFNATDSAAQAFQQALEREAEEMKSIIPLLEEALDMNADLEQHAGDVANSATHELSDSRLEALEQVNNFVQSIKLDEASFKRTLEEGNNLLEKEAQLEKERLMLERQRIQLQAETDWLKVQDEPENRILVLQKHIKAVQQRITEVSTCQNEVQKRIFELVKADHPELAWKSIASSSRLLRLIKGSGLWLNLSFSDFQIISVLSTSANSKVYHAVRRGEQFALKEIPIDDEKVRSRLQDEVNIAASCSHPNIARVKGVFFDGPFAYILLPYYERGSLKAFLAKKKPIAWEEVQSIFRQLATGVAYLHERGVCHADIKPSNILMSDNGYVVISDFGIAKDNSRLGEGIDITVTTTNTGGKEIMGTMPYMAPEQLLGEHRSATSKSDIWALGVTFYEVAAHNAFFHDASLTEPTFPIIPESGRTVEVPTQRIGGDEKLADLIMSALTIDVNRRATAYELLAHPYFSSSISSISCNSSTAMLSRSDERINAVRSYIHAIRANHSQKVLVSVSRHQMVESLMNIFDRFDEQDVMTPIMVVFQGESGIDEGALTTEMLTLFYEQLVKQEKALVCSIGQEASTLSHDSDLGIVVGITYIAAEDDKNIRTGLFELLGKVLLKSIVENRPLPLQLNLSVLKYFCGAPVFMQDLEVYDHALAQSLKRLRLLSSEDLEAAELKFSTFTTSFLSNYCNGKYMRETNVTIDNVRDYVELRVQFDLIERRKRALEAMKKGFFTYQSIGPHLKLLTPSDLLLLLCGVQHVSAQAILDMLEFHGFDSASKTPMHLKEVLLSMSQNNLRRFLQLCTSSAALPSNNSMKIKVVKTFDTQHLPVGHGCVQQLDLPDYDDINVLKEKLEIALVHVSDGFHIV